ncbi:MAG: hypothetical protein ABIO24_06105 [Saprospiraceae bacterium]
MFPLRLLSKTLVPGLGALLAFQAVGWYLSWGILMLEAKKTAWQEGSPGLEQQVEITLAATDLARLWVGEREIRLDGALCDVFQQVQCGDSVQLEIYHDRPEEALFDTLFALLNTQKDAGRTYYGWLCQLLDAAYLLPQIPILPQRADGYLSGKFFYHLRCAQSSPAHSGPPPKS